MDDCGAEGRIRKLAKHPRMPGAETPRGPQALTRVGIIDVLVEKRAQVLTGVGDQTPAHRTAGLGTGIDQSEESDEPAHAILLGCHGSISARAADLPVCRTAKRIGTAISWAPTEKATSQPRATS